MFHKVADKDRLLLWKMISCRIILMAAVICSIVELACNRKMPGFDEDAQVCSRLPMTQEASSELKGIVERAVTLANAILAVDIPFRLGVAWQKPPPAAVAVFLARDTGLTGIAEVPSGCRCIIVHPIRLKEFRDFGNLQRYEFPVDSSEVLALLLLHEAGHAYYRDTQGGPPGLTLDVAGVPLPKEFQMSREVRADLFAAGQLAKAINNRYSADQFSGAINLQIALSNAATNQVLRRTIDYFGESFLRPETAFADHDEVHPGLELRLQMMRHAALPLPDTAQNLAQAFADRARGKQRAERQQYLLEERPLDKERIFYLLDEGKLTALHVDPELKRKWSKVDGGSELGH